MMAAMMPRRVSTPPPTTRSPRRWKPADRRADAFADHTDAELLAIIRRGGAAGARYEAQARNLIR